MRFDDSGYDAVNVAIKGQQSICRNAGGYLMGIARKQRVRCFVPRQSVDFGDALVNYFHTVAVVFASAFNDPPSGTVKAKEAIFGLSLAVT